jgi:hypothetical protein
VLARRPRVPPPRTARTPRASLELADRNVRGVTLGLVVQQLCEPEYRCCGQRYREFEIVDVQSASPIGGFNVSQCAGLQAAIRHELAYSDVEQYANFVGSAPKPSNGQPEAASEHFGGVIHGWQAVEHRAEGVEDFVERGLEQLFFAVEVVIERAHADIGGLGYLEHRNVEFADGDEALRGFDQRRPRPVLASLQPIGQHVPLVCHCAPVNLAHSASSA